MKQLSIHLFLVFALLGCGESEPNPEPISEELIPPSEVGAGFVSCLIDGEVWNVRNLGNANSSLTAGGLRIGAGRTVNNVQEGISFEVVNVTQKGIYSLDRQPGNGLASYSTRTIIDGITRIMWYQTNAEYNGQMTITFLDTEKNIISGTFFFDAIDSDTGEIIEIRDGRFDIKL